MAAVEGEAREIYPVGKLLLVGLVLEGEIQGVALLSNF